MTTVAFVDTTPMAHILVVDDNQVFRVLLQRVLQEAEHELRFASQGADALAVFYENDIDLVITDLAMPNGSGLWLINQIRDAFPSVPIIAVSATGEEFLLRAASEGASAVLAKPINPVDLTQTVERLLAGDPGDCVWGHVT